VLEHFKFQSVIDIEKLPKIICMTISTTKWD